MTPADLGVELLNPALRRGGFRAVLFDFDGTLSLLREGWPTIMAETMVEAMRLAPHAEPEPDLARHAIDLVTRLNGQPTLQQMEHLAEEVARRGGVPRTADEYKQAYLNRLMAIVRRRVDALRVGHDSPDTWRVPGTGPLLAALERRGLTLVLASGTDWNNVREEAELLGLGRFFGERLHAPRDNGPIFSKGQVIDDLLADLHIDGTELLGIGDGPVETAEVKRVGGVAVGIAHDRERPGQPSLWRRERLAQAGADVIVTDYRRADDLAAWLCGDETA
jgi:phosphoglycolate phosphatase-like HAD superfamily hydrolase